MPSRDMLHILEKSVRSLSLALCHPFVNTVKSHSLHRVDEQRNISDVLVSLTLCVYFCECKIIQILC